LLPLRDLAKIRCSGGAAFGFFPAGPPGRGGLGGWGGAGRPGGGPPRGGGGRQGPARRGPFFLTAAGGKNTRHVRKNPLLHPPTPTRPPRFSPGGGVFPLARPGGENNWVGRARGKGGGALVQVYVSDGGGGGQGREMPFGGFGGGAVFSLGRSAGRGGGVRGGTSGGGGGGRRGPFFSVRGGLGRGGELGGLLLTGGQKRLTPVPPGLPARGLGGGGVRGGRSIWPGTWR